MTVPCDVWISVTWSSDPPPPTFFRSFIGLNERKMKRFSNEQKRKKKEMSLKLKKMFFLFAFFDKCPSFTYT